MQNIKIRFIIIFFILFLGYFIFPLVLDFIYLNNIYKTEIFYIWFREYGKIRQSFNFNNSFFIYEILSLFALLFIFFLFVKFVLKGSENKNNNNSSLFYLLIFLLPLLALDVYKLLIYQFENTIIERIYIYESILSGRRTHVNIILILAVAIYRQNKFLSLAAYILLITYDYLSLSRIELIWLIFMHFIVNVKFNRKNLKLILLLSMILTIAISYRAIFHSGSWQNIFIDPLHLKLSSLRLLQTFKDTDINFYFYINENILFALKNYFYLNFELFNFFQSELSDVDSGRVFSVRGIDTIFIFFPVFILSIVIFLILSNYLKEEINFIQSCNAYLLCIFFRGHFVHNLNFIIKLLVLILIINFLLQKFRSKKV